MSRKEFDRLVYFPHHNIPSNMAYLAAIKNAGRTHGVMGSTKEEAKNNLWGYLITYVFKNRL